MLNKLKKSDNKGFTIIEVMIVLAIAGLIILIVLLAVPALQRNGRNTTVKSDASAVVAAIQEFRANNDGNTPNAFTGTGTINVTRTGLAGVINSTAKVSPNTTVITAGAATATNVVVAQAGAACPGTVASARSVAVRYWVETSTAGASKCIDA